MRSIILDKKITAQNTIYLPRKEKAEFLKALGQRIGKSKKQVQNIVSRKGLCLEKYKPGLFFVREALSYYS